MPHTKSLILTLCAITEGDRVLLLKRNKEPYLSYWGMPGGKMHFGESVAESAIREAREETGLEFRHIKTCGVATETITGAGGEAEAHFVMFIVNLEPTGGTLTESSEGALKWFNFEDLAVSKIIPSDLEMLNRYYLDGEEISSRHFDVRRSGDSFSVAGIRKS